MPADPVLRAFWGTCGAWNLTVRELCTLLGMDTRTVKMEDASERIMAVLIIGEAISGLLADKGDVAQWLREPREDLDGQSPMEIMLCGGLDGLHRIVGFTNRLAGR